MTGPLFEPNHDPADDRDTDNRTPIVLAIIAGVLLIGVVIALVAFLTRPGDPTVDPAPAPTTASPTATTPTPVETTPVAQAAEVTITGEGFTITGTDGSTAFTHAWVDAAAPAVDALTEAFGEAPTKDFQNGDADNWAYDIYVWDDFRLYDVFLSAGNRPREEIPAPTYLTYSSDLVGDAEIVDEFDLDIGMSVDDARALGPDAEGAAPNGGIRFVFGADRGTFWSDGVRDFSALADTDPGGTRIASVTYTFYDG